MNENYIVLKGIRYDILTQDDVFCDSCELCKYKNKCEGNIIDTIDEKLSTMCELDVVLIKHEE